jgi:cobalt-zinc-cadmium efflux system protein
MHGHDHRHGAVGAGASALAIALGLNAAYTVAEGAAGVLVGSMALLADAAHNLSDVLALAVALFAARLARRPPTPTRSFGYMRAEILSALCNGVLVVAMAAWIAVESLLRLGDPPSVTGGWLTLVAAAGIAVNAASAAILARSARDNLNVRASIVHLGTDALASLGVVVGGIVIAVTGWYVVDPLLGLGIAVLIALGARGVLSDAVHILLEGAPRGIDVGAVGARLAAVPGVRDVHDLHVWEITSGFPALSAHVLVEPGDVCHATRRALERLLADEFHIEHTTLQVDHARPELIQISRG